MTDFNATAEFVRRHIERQKDIIALGDALKEIGSIDLARQEQQTALDKVNAELKASTDSLAAMKAEHGTFVKSRAADLAKHQANAKAIAATADEEAEGITTRAQEVAQGAIDAANADVERIQAAHSEAMATARAELGDIQTQLDAALDDLEAVKAERDAVKQSIQTMRDMARSALGAPA